MRYGWLENVSGWGDVDSTFSAFSSPLSGWFVVLTRRVVLRKLQAQRGVRGTGCLAVRGERCSGRGSRAAENGTSSTQQTDKGLLALPASAPSADAADSTMLCCALACGRFADRSRYDSRDIAPCLFFW
jgi:hypothetical protein